MFDLTDKKALVTGAASGIGRATAQALAKSGAAVWIADVNEEQGEAVAEAIRQDGRQASFVKLDVSSASDCETVHAEVGALDILVNNAGIGKVGTLLETSEEDLDAMYQVNVKGVFQVSKAFLPDMIKRGSGSIINMASIGGVVGVKDRLAYCMSKFAVVGMTKTMALDHSASGVRINAICPGRVETEFVQGILAQYDDPEKAYKEMSSTQLLERMARPEEIAAAVVYLASDESSFVTGSTFMIDGGWSAGKIKK
jgi:NAD(P)-dependent dehydrogenase (short-subunit alcohol dehydrogenase family)